jgi:FtsP/CotA-like multicopper oxidase with cupredoxin domain
MAVGSALPFSPIAAERHTNPLKIPKLIDEGTAARTFELDVAAGISNFLPDLPTPTLGINGAYLGPTIRVRAGHLSLCV